MEVVGDTFAFFIGSKVDSEVLPTFAGDLGDGNSVFGMHIEGVRMFDMRNDMQTISIRRNSLSIAALAQG